MKRTFSIILLIATLFSLFTIPVSAAETITDLKKVYNNLSDYLYTPYYENSKYFEAYQQTLTKVGELLESDDITQAEISEYYNKLREDYAQLMQDTYDYSSLEVLLKTYDALDSSIFSQETWKKILSIRDSAKKELSSPALFARTENMSAEQYAAHINNHISSFTSEFNAAFNRLEFVDRPEVMTPEYLSGIIKLIRFCARPELLAEDAALQEAIENAEKSLALAKPRDGQLDQDYDALIDAYFNVCNATYDFSAAKEALSTYHLLNAKDFTKDSWLRYAETATALEERMTQPHFFFIPLDADKETCENYASAYLSSLPATVEKAHEALISVESYEKLEKLCLKYENKTSMDGLNIKLNLLKKYVSQGKELLTNKDATGNDVTTAITNIENAFDDLALAEKHLIQEQGKVIKTDEKTSRYTVILFIGTFVLAAGLAMFLSKFFYGRINWSR